MSLVIPALFTSTSIRPCFSLIDSKSVFLADSSVKSALIKDTFSLSREEARSSICGISAMITVAPSAARRLTVAEPIPPAPPVTTQIFSDNSLPDFVASFKLSACPEINAERPEVKKS